MSDGDFSPVHLGNTVGFDVTGDVEGTRITSYDTGQLEFMWHDCPGVFGVPAFPEGMIATIPYGNVFAGEVYSDKNGGGHSSSEIMGMDIGFLSPVHKGKHDYDPKADSFVDFKIDTGSGSGNVNHDGFNEPYVYGYASADLRQSDQGRAHMPWEINPSGVDITVASSSDGKGHVDLGDTGSARGKARAVAKAMVYYHRLGDWKDPPNFFNPYWRAKMQPFDSIAQVDEIVGAGAATDSLDANQIAGMDALYVLGAGALNIK
jgi:hypothetical protein